MGVREAALEVAVRARLNGDKRVGDLPISPHVVDGIVYLIGKVDTLEQRDIAAFLTRGTPGVRNVSCDELEIGDLARHGVQDDEARSPL